MMPRHAEARVEFHIVDDAAAIAEYAGAEVDPTFNRIASFRLGRNREEVGALVCCVAALAKLMNGVVFCGPEGKLYSPDEAIADAKQYLPYIPKPNNSRKL